jgi:integrase
MIPMNAEVRQAFLDCKKKQDEDKKKYRKKWGRENPLADALPDPVFTTSPGNPYLPGSAYQETRCIIDMVNRKEEKLAIEEHREPHLIYFSPHMLRHTFVTHCVESGMDYASIRKITGHADLKMTEYYTHLEQEHLKHSYQKYEEKYVLFNDKKDSLTEKN